jgi:hypothetical protein
MVSCAVSVIEADSVASAGEEVANMNSVAAITAIENTNAARRSRPSGRLVDSPVLCILPPFA